MRSNTPDGYGGGPPPGPPPGHGDTAKAMADHLAQALAANLHEGGEDEFTAADLLGGLVKFCQQTVASFDNYPGFPPTFREAMLRSLKLAFDMDAAGDYAPALLELVADSQYFDVPNN